MQCHGCLSEIQAIQMLKQLFDALLFLYEDHMIVHRDIKPENILVFRNSFPHSDLLSEYTEFLRSENSIIYKLCGEGRSDRVIPRFRI